MGQNKREANFSHSFRWLSRNWIATAIIGANDPRVPMDAAAAAARRKSPSASSGSTRRRRNSAAIPGLIGMSDAMVSMAAAGSAAVKARVSSRVWSGGRTAEEKGIFFFFFFEKRRGSGGAEQREEVQMGLIFQGALYRCRKRRGEDECFKHTNEKRKT